MDAARIVPGDHIASFTVMRASDMHVQRQTADVPSAQQTRRKRQQQSTPTGEVLAAAQRIREVLSSYKSALAPVKAKRRPRRRAGSRPSVDVHWRRKASDGR